MERFDVDCQNDECGKIFEYTCESENAGEDTGHSAKCPHCGVKTYFEISYIVVVDSGSLGLDVDL